MAEKYPILMMIFENWQVVFVYGLKILADIKKELHTHKTDIAVIKYALELNQGNKSVHIKDH